MSAETFFLKRKDQPGLRDLDDVVLLSPAVTVSGRMIPAGAEGTVVAVLAPGKSYVVEFPDPVGTLATVQASMLTLAIPAAL